MMEHMGVMMMTDGVLIVKSVTKDTPQGAAGQQREAHRKVFLDRTRGKMRQRLVRVSEMQR